MDAFKLSDNICRICLDPDVLLNWNDEIFEFCGISYKDCYYKYIQLDENDSDCFPGNLCEMCADELRNAHFLFEKALESHNILQAALYAKQLETTNSCIEIPDMYSKTNNTEQCSNVCYRESEDAINNSIEETEIESVTIESINFINLHNSESSETLLEQKFSDEIDTELSKSNNDSKKVTSKCSDTKLPCPVTRRSKENKRKECGKPLEQNLTDNSGTKSPLPSTSNQIAKRRKKYILICQYCSLKVDGMSQLKRHEATHSENRKRSETCPRCGIKLYTKMTLNEHMKIHEEHRQKKHKCEFCEKAFFNKGALNVHRRIHLGLMVMCVICSKEFYRQIDLDKHLLKHSAFPLEKNVGKSKYTVQCQYCNKSVLTNKWKEHKAVHLDQPQVKCKICDKKFFARSKCVNHLRRLHHKSKSEYDNFIHYLVDHNTRMSHLKVKQEEKVQPLVKESL